MSSVISSWAMTRWNSPPRCRPGSGSLVDRKILRTTRFEVIRRPDLRRQGVDIAERKVRIPGAAEQGNKSDEQGDKIDDQGIKSAEHGKAGHA
jgi:hypothetical protein